MVAVLMRKPVIKKVQAILNGSYRFFVQTNSTYMTRCTISLYKETVYVAILFLCMNNGIYHFFVQKETVFCTKKQIYRLFVQETHTVSLYVKTVNIVS